MSEERERAWKALQEISNRMGPDLYEGRTEKQLLTLVVSSLLRAEALLDAKGQEAHELQAKCTCGASLSVEARSQSLIDHVLDRWHAMHAECIKAAITPPPEPSPGLEPREFRRG